jgi:hypothetical protein
VVMTRIENFRRNRPDNGMSKHSMQSPNLLLKMSTL